MDDGVRGVASKRDGEGRELSPPTNTVSEQSSP